MQTNHPYRSVLYLPGSKSRVLEKAKSLVADAVIIDLEDAVAPQEKIMARDTAVAAVRAGGLKPRKVMVRINGLDTEWGNDDLAAAAAAGPDAVLIPKVNNAADVRHIADELARYGAPATTRIWAMIETAFGILNAAEIAASHPLLEGFVLGTNDLNHELRTIPGADRMPLVSSLSISILAARACGLVCVDGVYNAFRDTDGLQVECEQGKSLGFDGKSLIHPAQLEVANEVFRPSEEELQLASDQVNAFDASVARGEGVAVLNGKIVENLHAHSARRVLALAASISELEAVREQD